MKEMNSLECMGDTYYTVSAHATVFLTLLVNNYLFVYNYIPELVEDLMIERTQPNWESNVDWCMVLSFVVVIATCVESMIRKTIVPIIDALCYVLSLFVVNLFFILYLDILIIVINERDLFRFGDDHFLVYLAINIVSFYLHKRIASKI